MLTKINLAGKPRTLLLSIIAVGLLYAVPTMFSTYRLSSLDEIVSFCLVVIGLNITMAIAGQDVIGLAATFSFAGFCIAVVAEHFVHLSLVGMCAVGVVAAVGSGALLALPALRVSGFYLGLATIFAAQLIPTVAQSWKFTGGQIGINLFVVTGFQEVLSGWWQYAVLLTGALLSTGFVALLLRSRLGHRFAALRSSEELARSLAIGPYRAKVLSVVIGSAFCGIGAAMYVYSQQFFSPGSASIETVILALAALVIGGAGTSWGPVLGTAIVFGVNSFIAFNLYSGIVFGGLLIVFVMFAPGGPRDLAKLGTLPRVIRNALRRHRPAAAVANGGLRLLTLDDLDQISPDVGSDGPPVIEREVSLPTVELASPAEMDGPTFSVRGARKRFGGVIAVDGVDLTLRAGEIHGLVGSNGSGKTTLLNLMSGFYRLDDGDIWLVDQPVHGLPAHVIADLGVARTFQTPKLILDASALDNVLVAAEQRHRVNDLMSILHVGSAGRVGRDNVERARSALQFVGLQEHAEMPVSGLSHGNQRLVEIARGLTFEPNYILMDEPGAGLSAAETDVLKTCVRKFAEMGIGVLLIEHNVPLVLEMADTITAMHEGSVIFNGSPEELRLNPLVADAFLGEVLQADVALDQADVVGGTGSSHE